MKDGTAGIHVRWPGGYAGCPRTGRLFTFQKG
jgi:hypothetical protein